MTTFVELKNGMVMEHQRSNVYIAVTSIEDRNMGITVNAGGMIILAGKGDNPLNHSGGMFGMGFNVAKVWTEK